MILAGLAISAGLSLNLVLQFALSSGAAGRGNVLPLFQTVNLFVSVALLWILHTYVFVFFPREFMEYFLFFPLSVLICLGIENLEKRLFPKRKRVRLFSASTAYEGLIPAALILTVHSAITLPDALTLAFFFALGCLGAVISVKEIRRRSALEIVPANFRGIPLAFISMGLLSMIFGAAAWICYNVLDNFRNAV